MLFYHHPRRINLENTYAPHEIRTLQCKVESDSYVCIKLILFSHLLHHVKKAQFAAKKAFTTFLVEIWEEKQKQFLYCFCCCFLRSYCLFLWKGIRKQANPWFHFNFLLLLYQHTHTYISSYCYTTCVQGKTLR